MSITLNGNGNGNGSHSSVSPPKPSPPVSKEAHVSFKNSDGVAMHGLVTGMSRHSAIFEIYSPENLLSNSESLADFSLNLRGKSAYCGRAVIASQVRTGSKTVCEVTLDELRWRTTELGLPTGQNGQMASQFKDFLNQWQQVYNISSDFKLAVADLQTFFRDLQSWLNQMELQFKLAKTNTHNEVEILRQLATVTIPAINALFERFEVAALRIAPEQRAAHASYMRQHLHPFILCAPFAHRTFSKPRGYAGDYEMVNMIIRNGLEGESLFAKVLHCWFVSQPPAAAHRNRIRYLAGNIERESCRLLRSGRPTRIFNFACGPAAELQEFFQTRSFRSPLHFTLADFDDETLDFVRRTLHLGSSGARAILNYKRMSVFQLIKEHRRLIQSDASKFDLVYCAGLFDYLPDNTCRDLMDIFFDMVAPGGLLIATNVEPSNPLKCGMEYLLDWHLIYRKEKDLRQICPQTADIREACVRTDATGVNLFLEVRKPDPG